MRNHKENQIRLTQEKILKKKVLGKTFIEMGDRKQEKRSFYGSNQALKIVVNETARIRVFVFPWVDACVDLLIGENVAGWECWRQRKGSPVKYVTGIKIKMWVILGTGRKNGGMTQKRVGEEAGGGDQGAIHKVRNAKIFESFSQNHVFSHIRWHKVSCWAADGYPLRPLRALWIAP